MGGPDRSRRQPLQGGAYNWNKTKKMVDGKWSDVNVVHRGQRAILNGQEVTADGSGNWLSSQKMDAAGNLSGNQRRIGGYRPGIDEGDYSSGLESNKIVVDGVTYDMNNPEHKKLMNSRADGKIKEQHKKISETETVERLTDDATVTPLNSNPARPPRTAGEFGDFMKTLTADYGIKFPGEQQRNGYESIHLPGTDGNADEFSASDAVAMGMSPQQAIDRKAGGTTEIVIGGNMGAQSGSSPAADQGEAQRVVKGFNGHEFGGEHEAPASSGLDARRRAFLDYDGPGGSMMALRAAEASQGTIKQNGELYAVGDDGKGTRISAEGERALKKDGNQMASQDFLKNYRYEPTETADSQQPLTPMADVETDTGEFTRGLDSNVIEDPTETFRALGLNVKR